MWGFAQNTDIVTRVGLHMFVGFNLMMWSSNMLPQGLIVLIPIMYWTGVWQWPNLRSWYVNRKTLKQFRQGINAEDPFAELDKTR